MKLQQMDKVESGYNDPQRAWDTVVTGRATKRPDNLSLFLFCINVIIFVMVFVVI